MNVLAFNGSPRKNRNTGKLLAKALEGAASKGANTELVHLYDHDYKGCISCFACKLPGKKSYGRCLVKDGLEPFLEKAHNADAIILGTPFYFSAETGMMRSLMERLLFQYYTYSSKAGTLFKRKIKTALVYTMNIEEKDMAAYGKDKVIERAQLYSEKVFGHCEVFLCTDTKQFDDYSKYEVDYFNPAHKDQRHAEVFPQDLERAFALGARLASPEDAGEAGGQV